MTEPTDDELDELRQADGGKLNYVTLRAFRAIARAVLAKWGTPQPSPVGPPAPRVEPVAWLNPWRADQVTTDYDAYGRRGIPLYTTPQPTQAQAGAVPLTDDQLAEMMRETWGCVSIAPRHAMKFARAVEAAHGIGIKGGQHGTK